MEQAYSTAGEYVDFNLMVQNMSSISSMHLTMEGWPEAPSVPAGRPCKLAGTERTASDSKTLGLGKSIADSDMDSPHFQAVQASSVSISVSDLRV